MKIRKTKFFRLLFILAAALVEIAITVFIYIRFTDSAGWIETILRILSVIIVLAIIRNSHHLSSDIVWVVLIILFPVPGTFLYLLIGADLLLSRTYRNIIESTRNTRRYYVQDPKVITAMIKQLPENIGQTRYIGNTDYPVYFNTGLDYYPSGEEAFPVMLKELKKAEKFIFLEYFIIKEGEMWNSILDILKVKAEKGVDVRVMYDDLGSFMTLDASYADKLEEMGISCEPFNRINPVLGSIVNHRDHRKMMIIDGKVAFSGGINLADEYINVKERFGHWKDNVIRVSGEAVWSYTLMFLTHWNALRKQDLLYDQFKVKPLKGSRDGFIAPYGDTPLDDELVAQNIYMNILNQADKYCYIMTPYLIIDTEMINALILCAKRGVDVRIVTPGIPDKRLVYQITRSYYRDLIEGGVRIYEYSPGFLHSKAFVSDDECASVGSVNLDFRSLYLHFENSTYICGSEKIKEIRDDCLNTIAQSREVTLKDATSDPFINFFFSALRIFAPLL